MFEIPLLSTCHCGGVLVHISHHVCHRCVKLLRPLSGPPSGRLHSICRRPRLDWRRLFDQREHHNLDQVFVAFRENQAKNASRSQGMSASMKPFVARVICHSQDILLCTRRCILHRVRSVLGLKHRGTVQQHATQTSASTMRSLLRQPFRRCPGLRRCPEHWHFTSF